MEEKRIPELYPGWKTVRKIGSGSFGTVYEIERDLFGKIEKAALKFITIPQNDGDVEEMYSNGYDDASITAHFESYLANIVREYSLMVEMKGHTNVVYCDDIRYTPREDGIGWDITIKMELLTPLLKTLGSGFSEEQVIRLGKDLCRALALCKDRDIVHRDIKPQNIFVSKTGDYKLGDFGIAKTVEQTTGGTKIGTYSYMAPEVYHNKPYGSSADIYSLGLVMYWLLNERRMPFLPLPPKSPTYEETENARHRRFMGEEFAAPKNGSEELKQIVLKACAFDPKDRFASAQEMLDALKNLDQTDRVVNKIEVRQDQVFEAPTLDETCGPVFDSDGTAEETMTSGPVFAHEPECLTAGPEFFRILPPESEAAEAPAMDEQTISNSGAQVAAAPEQEEKKPGKNKKGLIAVCIATAVLVCCAVFYSTVHIGAETQVEIDAGNCGDNLTWVLLDGGTLIVSGTGNMDDYKANYSLMDTRAPWYEYRDVIRNVVIERGVTSIGEWAFNQCSFLIDVRIADSVERVNAHAFANCRSIESMVFPESVDWIDDWVFEGCTNLKSVTILNFLCVIDGGYSYDPTNAVCYSTLGYTDKTVIYANSVSMAQKFAQKFGYKFESID